MSYSDPCEDVGAPLPDAVALHIRQMSPLPAAVLYLCQLRSETELDMAVLTEKMALDPALLARTLLLANMTTHSQTSAVSTVRDATKVIGFPTLRIVMMGGVMRERFAQAENGDFDTDAFWRHTIATAALCRILAERTGYDGAHALAAGMLHDIGCLVLASESPKDYAAALALARREGMPRIEAERHKFGVDHAHTGSALASHWHFPNLVQEAIAFHHHPDRAGPFSLAPILHLADALAHVLQGAVKEEALDQRIHPQIWQFTGVSANECDALLGKGRQAVREILSIVG